MLLTLVMMVLSSVAMNLEPVKMMEGGQALLPIVKVALTVL